MLNHIPYFLFTSRVASLSLMVFLLSKCFFPFPKPISILAIPFSLKKILWLAIPALSLGVIWSSYRHSFIKSDSQKFAIIELNLVFLSLAFATLIRLLEAAPQLPKLISQVENYGYALYALHAPLSLYLLFKNYSYPLIVLINVFVVVVAYYLVEKPLREYGRKLSKA